MKHLILILLIGASFNAHSQGLLTNLRGCYPMDCDGAANSATTGSSYNGSINGGVSCVPNRFSAPNSAYNFGGTNSDYIAISNAPLLKPTNAICVSGWYRIGGFPTNSSSYLVYTNSGCNNSPAYGLELTNTTSGLKYSAVKTGCSPWSLQQMMFPTPVTLGAWNHVVFYISNTVIKIWVNNVSDSVIINFPFSYMANKPIVLGGTSEALLNAPYLGAMENLRFYDRRLSAAEITDLYTNDPVCASAGANVPPPPPAPAPCCLGNYCANSPNALTGDYQIPLSNFNFNFTSTSSSAAKVLIGQSGCAPGVAKLDVKDGNIGNGIYSECATSNGNNIAIRGVAGDPTSHLATNIFGVVGEGHLSPGNHISGSAGLAGFCGVMNSALMPVNENIGVYGNSISNGGRWAGYFDGDVNLNGTAWGSQYLWSSDKRFKSNITQLSGITEKIEALKGYTYNFKTEEFVNKHFPKTQQIGFIAQELREVFPQLVEEDSKGYLAVNYVGFIPVLLQAHKEQQTKIDAQENAIKIQQQQIEELKTLVQSLAGVSGKSSTTGFSTNVTLADKNSIVLNQNVPNPFAENTVITYKIPTDFSKAEIIFTTNDGVIVKTVSITEKGAGTLNVFANDLSHGMYTYTLVVDGKSIDSKKMVKQ